MVHKFELVIGMYHCCYRDVRLLLHKVELVIKMYHMYSLCIVYVYVCIMY